MIQFVNAKINIGLQIVARRPDGYHDLNTIFYPVGRLNGTPECPQPFCDILEITCSERDSFVVGGLHVDCPPEKNLVCRALALFRSELGNESTPGFAITLEKHIPDGAGLGGGSADASFTLRMLNDLCGAPFTDCELAAMALRLGADCPVFIANRPAFGEGVGEKLSPVEERLGGMWCVVVKPPVYVSTREAFAGITPRRPEVDLRTAYARPIEEWRDLITNDFEISIAANHPEILRVKERLYADGAIYASMSGSGSSLYGLFRDSRTAEEAAADSAFADCYVALCRL